MNKIKEMLISAYKKIKDKVTSIYEKLKEVIKDTAEYLSIIDIEEGQARWSLNWWVLKSFKWLMAVLLAVCALFLWGCSSAGESIKYYPVNIPISCQIETPEKPVYDSNIITTNLNILKYASQLEYALKACKGEE